MAISMSAAIGGCPTFSIRLATLLGFVLLGPRCQQCFKSRLSTCDRLLFEVAVSFGGYFIVTAIDFSPSLQKIARAERKLNNLISVLDEWAAGGIPYNVRRDIYGERVHVIARIEKTLPDDIAWEVVEAVGHIRSALDKMLVAVVESNGRGVSSIGFPFGGVGSDGKPEPFPTARHDALKKKLTPDQWALILAQKPYPSGNDLLWSVNEIANEDKHRKGLVKIGAALKTRSISISNGYFIATGGQSGMSMFGDIDFVCPDQERETLLTSYAFGPGSVHPQIEQTISLSIVFGPVRPVAGREVIPTLTQQIRLVKGIVEVFTESFTVS